MDKKQVGLRTTDAIKSVPIPLPVQYRKILTKYVPRILSRFSKYKLIEEFLLLFGCKSKLVIVLILLAI